MILNRNVYISITSDEQANNKKVFSSIAAKETNDIKLLCGIMLKFPIIFAKQKHGKRKTEFFESIDVIQYDFDEGITCEQIQEKLKDYFYIMAGSKNHQKEKIKEDKVIPACDRFHVFLFLDSSITNSDYYKYFLERFAKQNKFIFKLDHQAKDVTRYFDKHSCIIKINEGKYLTKNEYFLDYMLYKNMENSKDKYLLNEGQETILNTPEEHIKEALKKFIRNAEESVSGECGHNTTFKTACTIQILGGTYEDFCFYNNTKCNPKWSDRELKHKWLDAKKKNKMKISKKLINYWRNI